MSASMPELTFTPLARIARTVDDARAVFATGRTKDIAWRKSQLAAMRRMMQEAEPEMREALHADLRRPAMEVFLGEVLMISAEIDHALSHLDSWVKPFSVPTPAALLPGSSFVQYDPLGVACIIAPWNFPMQLCFAPLVAAIAAGNTAVIKPSEMSPACAVLIERLVEKYLDVDAIRVVQGGVPETKELLKQRFDHIMYTGNGFVAVQVLEAAAKFLTPVTLELGGKSPTLVAADADLALAAKRILLAKCMNAGQVCLAPDYILVEESVKAALVEELKKTAVAFYGRSMRESPDFARIISARHFQRVKGLVDASKSSVVFGDEPDAESRFIGLTLMLEPGVDAPVMKEEIFGPLLPILGVPDMAAAIRFVNERPKPLALYIFTSSSHTSKRVLKETTSGGAVVNDAVSHIAVPDLPFGGVGDSGMGAYHGKWGFETYSHRKAVFVNTTLVDMNALRYPPFSGAKLKRLATLVKLLPAVPAIDWRNIAILGLTAALAGVLYTQHYAQGSK